MYSKFGTLMTLRLPIQVKSQELGIQAGDTLLNFSYKNDNMSCCINEGKVDEVVHTDEMNELINTFYKEIEEKVGISKNSK
jgi:hypothetical protein